MKVKERTQRVWIIRWLGPIRSTAFTLSELEKQLDYFEPEEKHDFNRVLKASLWISQVFKVLSVNQEHGHHLEHVRNGNFLSPTASSKACVFNKIPR